MIPFLPRTRVLATFAIAVGVVAAFRSLLTPVPIGHVIDAQMALEAEVDSTWQAHGDPSDFSAEELQTLQRRFGVHGPQTPLAQLFTEGVDQFEPLRSLTLTRLTELKPVILRQSQQHHVNPMLLAGILYDELQHSKPGEGLPFVVHSGLISTHGPAQLGISELIHQGRLPSNPTHEQVSDARDLLLDPSENVALLAGKLSRLKRALQLPPTAMLNASASYADAKAIATLAYLHNGKLDYPARILRYMQDPALHGLIYSTNVKSNQRAI